MIVRLNIYRGVTDQPTGDAGLDECGFLTGKRSQLLTKIAQLDDTITIPCKILGGIFLDGS